MKLRACKVCTRIATHNGYCDAHQTMYQPEKRKRPGRWRHRIGRRVRARYLSDHPYCLVCMERGKATPATQVHHVMSRHKRPDLELDTSNFLAVCDACHDDLEYGRPSPAGGEGGCES